MKVAITGKDRGLGKELSTRFDEVVGVFSDDCDVFINNAHEHFEQTKVLMDVFEKWKDTDKTIVNIVSRSKYPNISKGFLYSASKSSLNHLSNSLRLISDKKCRIIDINPGLLNVEQEDYSSASFYRVNVTGGENKIIVKGDTQPSIDNDRIIR